MATFPTPLYHNDGYTDDNRPDAMTFNFNGTMGRWSSLTKVW